MALLALVASVAAIDSINPSTLGPALFLAVGERPARAVAGFVAGVFAVSLLGGAALLLGPGRALLTRVATPSQHTQHLAEVVSGGVLLLAAAVLWIIRGPVRRRIERPSPKDRSGLILGAGIMAVELPTAFPYFAGLVAVVESKRGITTELLLVLLYNVIFVAPLLAILALVVFAGEAAKPFARRARKRIEALAPTLGPVALACIGAVVLAVGVRGL